MSRIARVLAIAGSDSGGGAGIQADIKTITMLGGHAMTVITAITAQNTLGVDAVQVLAPDMVIAQIDAVLRDIGVDAIKIGMIGSAGIANAVADRLDGIAVPIVLDPVMVASSGASLADEATIAALWRLMPRAQVVTPNLPELAVLGGAEALAAQRVTVLAKGGHGAGDVIVDVLSDGAAEVCRWSDTRIDTRHSHGTGCTLASGIAAGLGQGMTLVDAISRARRYVRAALLAAPGLGAGHGPMGHALDRSWFASEEGA